MAPSWYAPVWCILFPFEIPRVCPSVRFFIAFSGLIRHGRSTALWPSLNATTSRYRSLRSGQTLGANYRGPVEIPSDRGSCLTTCSNKCGRERLSFSIFSVGGSMRVVDSGCS